MTLKVLIKMSVVAMTILAAAKASACRAITQCPGGSTISCYVNNAFVFGITVIPSCQFSHQRWVSCVRADVNGMTGYSEFKTCDGERVRAEGSSAGGIDIREDRGR